MFNVVLNMLKHIKHDDSTKKGLTIQEYGCHQQMEKAKTRSFLIHNCGSWAPSNCCLLAHLNNCPHPKNVPAHWCGAMSGGCARRWLPHLVSGQARLVVGGSHLQRHLQVGASCEGRHCDWPRVRWQVNGVPTKKPDSEDLACFSKCVGFEDSRQRSPQAHSFNFHFSSHFSQKRHQESTS